MTRCTYIFIDEAGNLDFSADGSRYFVLAGVSMRRPFRLFKPLDEYKYDCIEYGLDNEYFHCTDDNKHVRGKVFDIIGAHLDGICIDCLAVEKAETDPALWEDKRFYPAMLGDLLKLMLSEEFSTDTDELIVITDTIPVNKKRKAVEKSIRLAFAKMLPSGMKHRILHHSSRSHYGLQVADYCCWAVYRGFQTGETTWFNRIRPAMRNKLGIFRERPLNW